MDGVRARGPFPNRRPRLLPVLAAALAVAMTFATAVLGAGGSSGQPAKDATGVKLYRTYCGQCHALTAARAAGFGSNKGLGTDGGPSFNPLRVPFQLSVLAIRQPFIGHEALYHKMNWNQIQAVSKWIANVTRNHPVLAQYVDG
jgi:mono/diheme cytochrome c family protein